MSIPISVYLNKGSLPSPSKWQEAIREHGYELQLDVDIDLTSFSGFWPVKYRDVETGFEFYLDDVDAEEIDDAAQELLRGKDIVISFVTHGDSHELAASIIAAGVLAHLSDGVVHEEDADEYFSSADTLLWVKKLEQEILIELGEG